MKSVPMSREARIYFEQVALDFRSLAVSFGYDASRYPNRSVRSNCYHDKVKFRLRDQFNAIRTGVFVVDESFRANVPTWILAQRIFDELTVDRRYVTLPGIAPKRFADQALLLRREPAKAS